MPGRSQPTRRAFLSGSLTAAAGVAVSTTAHAEHSAAEPLPTVALGPHRITRLILGGNPIYGYSHFNRLYSQHLREYHTPERVVQLVRHAIHCGINCWQNSYAERTVADVRRCREAGLEFHWLLLGKPDWDRRPELIERAAAEGPIGIAPHGALAERLRRRGQLTRLRDLLKRIRDTGVLVGLSAHDPTLIEQAEEEGWDVDYYMVALYYLTRPREEFRRLLGELPLGEIYLPSDRQRALRTVQATQKPCLVYKVLAAGRMNLSASAVRRTLHETLDRIKPTDAMIVGMFQEFEDQVGMNARFVREWARQHQPGSTPEKRHR